MTISLQADRDFRARVAIDLGAQSCRVSILRWLDGVPTMEPIHRIPNDPIHEAGHLYWPFELIMAGLEEGLTKAARRASEGIASIAVDGWAVDYVRLGGDRRALVDPFCYRDERTIVAKEMADRIAESEWVFGHTGAQPLRINTVYQLIADRIAGIAATAPWLNLPEYVLYRLGGRPVSEYTNATHTGLVDLRTGTWSHRLLGRLDLAIETCPEIVPSGTIIGKLSGPLAELPAFRDTDLIVPACHDTASSIAGIPSPLDSDAYICCGTWSLVGTIIENPVTTREALKAGFTNQGAAGGGFCFHKNVNGLWLLKQCVETWSAKGRFWDLSDLIAQSAACDSFPGVVPVDAPALLLDGDMPALLNEQLSVLGCEQIENRPGNEPIFARVIFESLASQYAVALRNLEQILGRKFERVHVLGGGAQNQVLTRLTAQHTGLKVEIGNVESATVGNFAVQMASADAPGNLLNPISIRDWAQILSGTDKDSVKGLALRK